MSLLVCLFTGDPVASRLLRPIVAMSANRSLAMTKADLAVTRRDRFSLPCSSLCEIQIEIPVVESDIYLERRFRVFFFFIWLEIFETCNLLQLKKKCVFCIAILENFWFLEKFVKL